ncbi:MAG TPA: MFS transporter [Rugosimonospora sp.]
MSLDAGRDAGTVASRPRRGLRHHPDFRLLWAGQSVSLVGSAVSFVALPLVALLVLHVDAFHMGVLTAVERLPPLVVGPLAGPLADRGSRLRLMVVADAGRALLLAWIPVGAVLGRLAFWHLVVIAFGVGALTLLFNVAYPAFLPNVIPAQRLAEGNSKLAASQSAAEVTGSGLASLLIAAGGPPLGVLADALSYVVSCWCLLRLRTRDAARPAAVPTALRDRLAGFRDDVRSGFPLLWRDRVLRTVTVSNAILAFFAQLQAAIYFIFLVRTLHLGPGLIGALFLIAGGVGFLAAIWCDRLAARIGVGPLLVTGQVILVAGGTLLAVAGGPTLLAGTAIVAGEACFGAGLSLFGVGFTTLFQLRAADEVRGRLIGTSRFLTSASVPVAAVLGGVIGVAVSVRVVMVAGAVGMALGLVAVLRRRVLAVRGVPGP